MLQNIGSPFPRYILITVLLCLSFCNEGEGLMGWLRKAKCLIPKGIDHVTRALMLQQCISAKYGKGNETKCYNELGCFSMHEPWITLLRPFPSPYPPEEVDTQITLYTRDAPEGYKVKLWPFISMEGSDFDPTRVTAFLTHGFASNGHAEWILNMKDAYLQNEDANVFVVDWEKGSNICNYLQAASNTRIVGAEINRFGRYLLSQGLTPCRMHLVGHSLGAHIMSYMCKWLPGTKKVKRLTALDPAQPGFEGTNQEVRLDKSDAKEVDVIHTDAQPFIPFFGLGMIQPIGDIDFYMNGGSGQPGCLSLSKNVKMTSISDLAKIPVEWLAKWVSCSHGRSYEYFTWSLKLSNCSMWGRKMSTTETYLKVSTLGQLDLAEPIIKALDQCNLDTCSLLGKDTFKLKSRGIFSVSTKSTAPFCKTTEKQTKKLKNVFSGLYGSASSSLGKLKPFVNKPLNWFNSFWRRN